MRTVVKYLDDYCVPMSIDKEFGDLLNSIDKDLLSIEGLTREYLDISKRMDDYTSEALSTFSIEGNSNATGSKNYMSRSGEVFKAFEKLLNYQLLWRSIRDNFDVETANKCIKESLEGAFMVHDMTNTGVDALYCTTLPAKKVMQEGRPYNDVHSKAPRYADSFMGQIIELIIDTSSRFAGALAIPDMIVALSYYTKKESLTEKQVEQLFQRLTHLVNNPYRSGSQSPFFNLSLFTRTGLEEAFGNYTYPDNSSIFEYMDEVLKNQYIFAKYFGQGIEDENGIKKPVGFPVVTFNIIKDSVEKDNEYIISIFGCFNKFDNVNIYMGSADKFASCCRLINDTSKKNSINSFGAGAVGEQVTGSARVISMNLYDVALETLTRFNENLEEKYFEVLREKMDMSRDILFAQRKLVEKTLNAGLNIFYNLGWIKLEDYFSTWGAGGLHEAVKIVCNGDLKKDYTDVELEFAKKIPQFMEKYAEDNSTDFMKLNVEFLTPLESGAKRLGRRIDIKYNKRNTFISNQLLPLPIKTTIARRLEIENELGGATSAGGILHLSTEGEMPLDIKVKMISKIATNYPNVEHFAFNKTAAYCEDGHLTLGNVDECQYCKKPIVEKILRVIGYYRPVRTWSAPRQKEFEQRHFHSVDSQYNFIKGDESNE